MSQALLVEGKNRVRIHDRAGKPPEGFIPVPPTLEDAYLIMMHTYAGVGHDQRVVA